MAMPPLPPQEVAKLVLGYLRKEGLTTVYDEFLRTSPHLNAQDEFDRIWMRSLRSILSEYAAVMIHVDRCESTALREKLSQCTNILEKVKFLVNHIDVSKLQTDVSQERVSVELFSRTCDEALDWMSEKEQQLAVGDTPASDLRTVQALQRRLALLERELAPLREKVHTVSLLADDVKSQYSTERANVEARQREIQEVWERFQARAAERLERRSRLESAVGHQNFGRSAAMLDDWIQKVHELGQEATAKDVATAEALLKQHRELEDDIKTHDDDFSYVIGLGKQLLAINPSLADVAEKIKHLEAEQQAVKKGWQEKDAYLRELVELQAFKREADQDDASSGAYEAYLDYNQSVNWKQ